MDFDRAKKYDPGKFETFDENFGKMLIDLFQGDETLLKRPEIKALGPANIKAALEFLRTADINGDYLKLLANEGWRLKYVRKPPTPEEYLTTEWIGAQAESLWPNVREAFINFLDPNPLNPKRGMALSGSIGWGKFQPYDSNIVTDKIITIELEDKTKLEIPSNKEIEVIVNGKTEIITANELLKLDNVDLPQAVISKYRI